MYKIETTTDKYGVIHQNVNLPMDDEIEYTARYAPLPLGPMALNAPNPNYEALFDAGHGTYLGTRIIEESFGSFFHSNVYKTIEAYSEERGYQYISAYLTGRTSSDAVERSITSGNYSWIGELTGLGAGDPDDVDIYVTPELFDKVKNEFKGKSRSCRSADFELFEIEEVVDGKLVKIQVHCALNSDKDPLQTAAFLAPTKLHAAGVAVQGANLVVVDPWGAIQEGPYKQSFPEHLFDSKNELAYKSVRSLSNLIIYIKSVIHPQLPNHPDLVKNIVSDLLDSANNSQIEAILEKYSKWSDRGGYNDHPYVDSTFDRVKMMYEVGLFPDLFSKALQLSTKDGSETAFETTKQMVFDLASAHIDNPDFLADLDMPDEQDLLFWDKDQIVDLAKKINSYMQN